MLNGRHAAPGRFAQSTWGNAGRLMGQTETGRDWGRAVGLYAGLRAGSRGVRWGGVSQSAECVWCLCAMRAVWACGPGRDREREPSVTVPRRPLTAAVERRRRRPESAVSHRRLPDRTRTPERPEWLTL